MHDEYLVSHMQVVVYEVNLKDLKLPYTSKNGVAFWGEVNSDEAMTGLPDLVQHIENGEQLDVVLRYGAQK